MNIAQFGSAALNELFGFNSLPGIFLICIPASSHFLLPADILGIYIQASLPPSVKSSTIVFLWFRPPNFSSLPLSRMWFCHLNVLLKVMNCYKNRSRTLIFSFSLSVLSTCTPYWWIIWYLQVWGKHSIAISSVWTEVRLIPRLSDTLISP